MLLAAEDRSSPAAAAPSVNVNPGPMRAFMVALDPQAVVALTGVDMAFLVNRLVPRWGALSRGAMTRIDRYRY